MALIFIQDFRASHHYAPTMREVADGLGVAVSNAYRRLRGLERRGLVSWRNDTQRTLRAL